MSKNHKTKLDIISKIDEDIIDEVTDSRIALSKRIKRAGLGRKQFIIIGTCAASFLLICSILLAVIIPIIKQIPVYRGMSVSGSVTSEQAANEAYEVLSAGQYDAIKKKDDTTAKPTAAPNAPIDKYFDVEVIEGIAYYTKPNQDIYISVHIDNPKQYEILSFTLNGVKYQSYMFEPGSTSEELILKLNVGAVEGVVEYTIDAIKYVDGTEIKDVRMKGDKTVKIGVQTQKQPNATLSNLSVGDNSVSFDASVSDELKLIEKTEGKLYAAIATAAGTEIIEKKQINIDGTSSVKFEGLSKGHAYQLMIVAYYDSLDGKGFRSHTLYDQNISTNGYLEITSVTPVIGENLVTFDLTTDASKNVKVKKIELYTADGTLQKSIGTDERIFEWLYGGTYKIVVSYTFDLGDGKGEREGSAISSYFDILFSISTVVERGESGKGYSKTTQVYHSATADYRTHLGVDILARGDDTVYCPVNGTVTDIFDKGWNGGKTVVITVSGSNVEYHFASLMAVSVKVGQKLSGGEKIGKASDLQLQCSENAPMVHIEAYVDGVQVNPITLKP